MKANDGIRAALLAVAMLLPLHGANAWDYSTDGYRNYGGGRHGVYRGGGGYQGKYHGGGHYGNYHGGHHDDGCRGCDAAGAAIVGLAIGAIIGSAIADADRSSSGPPPRQCASVIVDGVAYYNCNRDPYVDDYSWQEW